MFVFQLGIDKWHDHEGWFGGAEDIDIRWITKRMKNHFQLSCNGTTKIHWTLRPKPAYHKLCSSIVYRVPIRMLGYWLRVVMNIMSWIISCIRVYLHQKKYEKNTTFLHKLSSIFIITQESYIAKIWIRFIELGILEVICMSEKLYAWA